MIARIKIVGFITCLAISCLGCGKGSRISYPSNAGAKWNYQVSSRRIPAENTLTATLTNLPQRDLQGRVAIPQELVLTERQNGRELTKRTWSFFVEENEEGLVASANPSATARYYLIKLPIAVGESWTTTAPFSRPPLSATSIVESVNESVTVPAGVFNGCLKIKVLTSPAKTDVFGNQFAVEGHLWFASGVGLVKATYQTAERGKQVDEVIVQLESHQN